jgi:short-subunit dehydrogenase
MTAAAKGAILVTGSNGGLSSAIIEQIVSKPEFSTYHGLYTVRDPTKAETLDAALKHSASHTHDIIALDLTKLDSVRQVAEEINVNTGALLYHFVC